MLRHGMEPVWRAGRGSYLARGGRGARRSVLCLFGAATNRGRVGDRGRGGVRRVELLLYGSSPGALCKRLSRCGGRATVGNASPLPDGGLCNSASVGLGPYSQADRLRLRYTFGNFGAVIDPGLVGSTDFDSWEGCRESRRCSRDTYPDSYVTRYTSIRRKRARAHHIGEPKQTATELSVYSFARKANPSPKPGSGFWVPGLGCGFSVCKDCDRVRLSPGVVESAKPLHSRPPEP